VLGCFRLKTAYGDTARLIELKAAKRQLEAEIPTTLVMEDKPTDKPLTAVVRPRGEFTRQGEVVETGAPAVLHPFPEGAPRNRLGLAQWLVARDNPLTARVQVNRMWATIFGRGIVETLENFGTQGAYPTHPELLDWLAVEFMESGWRMKHIYRLIVTSSTYRQSSQATPELLTRDPKNELYARAPRYRLPAELVRDVALAASGLLSRTIGGPSVFPPQPEGVWDIPFSGDRWETDTGENRYRRGLYTFWRRTAPYPSMVAFDAHSREVCIAMRPRTNTPLQSLVLLNDPRTWRRRSHWRSAWQRAARATCRRACATASAAARRASRPPPNSSGWSNSTARCASGTPSNPTRRRNSSARPIRIPPRSRSSPTRCSTWTKRLRGSNKCLCVEIST
jgi:hypothetical protein